MSNAENNKRIAKNTALLYVRMFFIMAVTLYTSRVVLQALGVEDYGIYNVVGGVITMLSFLTGSLAGASSRYITVALGKGDASYLQQVFSATRLIHLLLAGCVLLFGETVGLWFVLDKMVIPADRLEAAFWVYQCTIVISIVSVLSTPYNALIIAYERMSAFAYISIFEAVAKLAVVYLLTLIDYDHLTTYAFLLLLVQLTVRIIYTGYSRIHFPEVRARLREGRELLREILSYSSWCTLGYLSVVGYTQGLNILLNLFFGPAVNAARGVAVQVQSAVSQLCSNFQTALNPQITKSYASGNLPYMHQLVIYSSKYSCFLVMLVVLPIILNAKYILHLWLGVVPDHTVAFVRLTLVIALLECLKNPLLASIHATGDIKKLQTVEGLMLLSIVPIAYTLLKLGVSKPEWVFGVYLIVEAVTQAARAWLILPRIAMPYVRYVHEAVCPVSLVAVCLLPIPLCYEPDPDIVSLIWTTLASVLLTLCLIWALGLRGNERHFIKEKLELWKPFIKSRRP